jgi:hypothetical protein
VADAVAEKVSTPLPFAGREKGPFQVKSCPTTAGSAVVRTELDPVT